MLLGGPRALALQARDLRELGLCLPCLVLLVAEPRDEPFQPLDVPGDALGGLLSMKRPLGLLLAPRVPRPGEVGGAAGLELQGRVRDRFEKPAIVRDEQDGRLDRGQLALEPFDARDVQVVRRLVEEEEVRIAGQGTRKRRARELSAGEGGERPLEVGIGEPETADDRFGPVAPAVTTRVLEPRLGPGVGVQCPGVVAALGHGPLELRKLGFGRQKVGGPRKDVAAERQVALLWRPLIVEGDPRPLASSPPSGRTSPVSIRRSVVLPAPFGPASATRSLRSTLKDTPSKSGEPLHSLRRFETMRTAMGA